MRPVFQEGIPQGRKRTAAGNALPDGLGMVSHGLESQGSRLLTVLSDCMEANPLPLLSHFSSRPLGQPEPRLSRGAYQSNDGT